VQLNADDLTPDAPARWPGSVLAGLGTPWNTLQLQGTLALSSRALQMQWSRAGWASTGTVQLDALQLSTRLSSLAEVGSYRLTWDAQPTAVPTLKLSTLQGSLQLQGRGEWVGGRLRFQGEAQASTAQEAALSNLLNIMGRRDGARSIITVG
jgi:general secretion pathway protein N